MKSISVVFHPLLMSTYSCVILYFIFPETFSPIPPKSIPYFIVSIFILTFLVPGLGIFLLKSSKRLSNLDITNREERILPFAFIAAFYSISTYLYNSRMTLPHSIFTIMVLISVLVTIIVIISIKFKISVHSAGIWGTTGIFSAISMKYLQNSNIYLLLTLFLIAGLTTSSRLYLNRHTPTESWAGVCLGFMLCFVGFLVFG